MVLKKLYSYNDILSMCPDFTVTTGSWFGLLITHECPHWVAWSYNADQISKPTAKRCWKTWSLYLSTEVKQHCIGAVSNWMGERQLWVCVHPISKEKAEQLLATIPVSCHHIVRNWSKALHYIRIVESISMHSDYRTVLHNQPIWDSASASSSSSYCAQHISTSWHFVYGLWHDGAELFLLLMLQKMPGVCGRVLSN
jgi:hypothetical protein